jgi:hypothetical protein
MPGNAAAKPVMQKIRVREDAIKAFSENADTLSDR